MKSALVFLAVACALVAGTGWRATGGHTTVAYAPHINGDPKNGVKVIQQFNCGACHTIPGVRGATGVVAPPLSFYSKRSYIAGRLPNTPENLVHWIMDPQSVDPKNAMPTLGLNEQQARDVAAYLYTLQ